MGSPSQSFPPIRPGGSLMVAWQARQRHILVVGGGEVAATRIVHALNADAFVTVVAPAGKLSPEVAFRVSRKQVRHVDREFKDSDLDLLYPIPSSRPTDDEDQLSEPVSLVLVAINSVAISTRISEICRELRIPVNVADVPDECDFFFGSVYRDGPIQVMISTNGKGPRIAAILKSMIATGQGLPEPGILPKTVERVAAVRERVRLAKQLSPSAIHIRMEWMTALCDSWTFEELAALTDKDINILVSYYVAGEPAPARADLRQTGLGELNPTVERLRKASLAGNGL